MIDSPFRAMRDNRLGTLSAQHAAVATACDEARSGRIESRLRPTSGHQRPPIPRPSARSPAPLHYSERMSVNDTFARTGAPPPLLSWPRLRVALIASTVI